MAGKERRRLKIKDEDKFSRLHLFLKDSFGEELIGDDVEELKQCFTYDVEDKAVYFVKNIKQLNEELILIFYKYYCFIPLKSRKYLLAKGPCSINILILNYQKLLAKVFFEDVKNLSILGEIVKREHNIGDSPANYPDILLRDDGDIIFRSFNDFEKTYVKVSNLIRLKLAGLKRAQDPHPAKKKISSLSTFEAWKAKKIEELKNIENN